MRKYYQAALAITAVISIISLLFYKHEYNRLRYVLEVFNYFGKPSQRVTEQNCTSANTLSVNSNLKFEEPVSSWQRITDYVYVYSAYNIHKEQIRAVGYGKISSIVELECFLFFENEVTPVLGTFSHVIINGSSDIPRATKKFGYGTYQLICTYTDNKIPVGVIFGEKAKKSLDNAIILSIKSQSQYLNDNGIAVCIAPPFKKPMPLSDMIGFISFHELIGINNFIVYDFGIPNAFNSWLSDMSKISKGKFTYTIIPWNFPFPKVEFNIIKDIIEADCLNRVYNKVMHVVTLSWEEYIVLKYHHLIDDLMKDYSKLRMNADRYKLNTLTFCTQQSNDKQYSNSTLMIFKKTYFDEGIVESRPTYIHKHYGALKLSNVYSHEIGKDLIAINRYRICDKTKINFDGQIYDFSILRFFNGIQNSPIFRNFLANDIFG